MECVMICNEKGEKKKKKERNKDVKSKFAF